MIRLISLLLMGLGFAVPASLVAWWIGQSNGSPIWHWIPLPVAVGTFLTAIVVCIWMKDRTTTVRGGTMVGGMIGVLSHPVAAIMTVMMMPMLESLAGFEETPWNSGTQLESLQDYVSVTVAFTFWWCFIALCGIGWVTLVIGACTGAVIGGLQHCLCHRNKDLADPSNFWRTVLGPLIALAIITVLAGLAVALLAGRMSAQNTDRIEKVTVEPVQSPEEPPPSSRPITKECSFSTSLLTSYNSVSDRESDIMIRLKTG